SPAQDIHGQDPEVRAAGTGEGTLRRLSGTRRQGHSPPRRNGRGAGRPLRNPQLTWAQRVADEADGRRWTVRQLESLPSGIEDDQGHRGAAGQAVGRGVLPVIGDVLVDGEIARLVLRLVLAPAAAREAASDLLDIVTAAPDHDGGGS